MKKLISIILAMLSFSSSVFAEWVNVSASVWKANRPSSFIEVSPSYTPIVLATNTVQYFSITVKDLEWDDITYTITPSNGASSTLGWTLTDWIEIQNWTAKVDFIYLAGASTWSQTITLTLTDDWWSLSVKTIDLYIY